MRLLEKTRAYASELLFVTKHICGIGPRLFVAWKTVQLHWRNRKKALPQDEGAFEVDVRLANSTVRLRLRPFAGDLAIFYRSLLHKVDCLPEALSNPAAVRTIIDCGANIGMASIYFADRYPNARIIAIEPHPANFEILRANTASQPRITPIQACVGPSLDDRRFITIDKPAWGNQTNARGEGVEVPVVTIDSVCRDYHLDFVDILKIDIEGAEKDLFADPAFLPRVGIIPIELHGEYDLHRFRRDLASWSWCAEPADARLGTMRVIARPAIPRALNGVSLGDGNRHAEKD